MDYSIKIKRAENGYIAEWVEEKEKGDFSKEQRVFEDKDDIENNGEAIVRLLYAVAEHFGIYYDKYAERNLNIDWSKRGHKLSDDGE